MSSSTAAQKYQNGAAPRHRVRTLVNKRDGEIDDWFGNPVRWTNCDDGVECQKSGYNPTITFQTGYPSEYSCNNLAADHDGVATTISTSVSVDFVATIPVTANSEDNERALRWSVLNLVVKELSLDDCNVRDVLEADEGERRMEGGPTSPPVVFSLGSDLSSSSPPDFDCHALFPNAGLESTCLSIRSVFNVEFHGRDNETVAVENRIENYISETMTADPGAFVVNDVTGLRYVGDFDSYPGANAGRYHASDSTPIAPIMSASALFLLIGFAFAFRWRRRSERDVVIEKGPEAAHDLEGGNAQHSPSAVSNVPSSETATSTDSSCMGESGTYPTDATAIPAVESYDSTETPASTKAIVSDLDGFVLPPKNHALPPRPPRQTSVKLKKRRRKKKGKKKSRLRRTNSRENVTQMEAIPENHDEDSEIGSEGSEYYSTDEEGTSNHSSSDCLTPVPRSHPSSRASSRTSSPCLSPQDELFPSDVFSNDVDFYIEAPDFPFNEKGEKRPLPPRFTKSTTNQKDQPPRKPDQKDRIRPIPPPWV